MKSRKDTNAVAVVLWSIGFAAVAVACGKDRQPIDGSGVLVGADAGALPVCRDQCSIDGRSKVTVCDGEVTQTVDCPADMACGAGTCQAPCAAAAADRSSNGCEFYIQMPRYYKTFRQSCFAAFISNTSNQDATVALSYQGKSIDVSKSLFRTLPGSSEYVPQVGPIHPGDGAILFVSDRDRTGEPYVPSTAFDPDFKCPADPASHADIAFNGTGIGDSFQLTSTVPVSLASIYPFGGALSYIPASTLHLPVSAWANQHILVDSWEQSTTGRPAVVIVASEDDTEVTLVPKVNLQGGPGVPGGAAGTEVKIRLGKGQNAQLVQAEELVGSTVKSNKPVTTYGGNECAFLPSSKGACDILTQQIPALEQWGSEYVGVGYRPRAGSDREPVPYRIVAARDGTLLDYDPPDPPRGAPTSLSAGESAIFYAGTSDAFVVRTQDADHPIYLAAHMSGAEVADGTSGDPEVVNVVPTAQYLTTSAFYADPTFPETSLVVVRAKSGGSFQDVTLECAGTLTGFQPIGTRGQYEFKRIDLSHYSRPGDRFENGTGEGSVCQYGMQRMHSAGTFTATLWGWGYCSSYAYSSGSSLRKLVSNPGQIF